MLRPERLEIVRDKRSGTKKGAVVFKQGDEFARFFETDARRLAAGVRKVGRIEAK